MRVNPSRSPLKARPSVHKSVKFRGHPLCGVSSSARFSSHPYMLPLTDSITHCALFSPTASNYDANRSTSLLADPVRRPPRACLFIRSHPHQCSGDTSSTAGHQSRRNHCAARKQVHGAGVQLHGPSREQRRSSRHSVSAAHHPTV